MKLSEAVSKVIDLSRKILAYYDHELPKYYPAYPIAQPGDKEPPPPPEEAELKDFLFRLPADILYQLVLLLYIGRGYPEFDEVLDSYEAWQANPQNVEYALTELRPTVPLADELSDALDVLKEKNIDVDALPLHRRKGAGNVSGKP